MNVQSSKTAIQYLLLLNLNKLFNKMCIKFLVFFYFNHYSYYTHNLKVNVLRFNILKQTLLIKAYFSFDYSLFQIVVYSLVLSFPAVFHVILVVLFIWLPFAIIAVHNFAGKFFRCVGDYREFIHEEIYNKTICLEKGYRWEEMFYNFNHIGNSYLSLLQLVCVFPCTNNCLYICICTL